jgi:signal transduction histidine kinase
MPVSVFSEMDQPVLSGPLPIGLNLIGLAFLDWGVVSEVQPGLHGSHLGATLLMGAGSSAWLVWLVARHRGSIRTTAVALVAMSLAGGALAVYATTAIVYVGVAALGATMAWPVTTAAGVVLAGPLVSLVSVLVDGRPSGIVVGSVSAALGGTVIGVSRRQYGERTRAAAQVAVTEARADAEAARAELLAGRNHLARELHDVLAHTLSALSLQLEALDATMHAGGDVRGDVREQLDRTKRLVREGLDEARGAVRALREDAPPLDEQLTRLAEGGPARVAVEGTPRPLAPDVTLALYRVAQEALTNVVKHAPGSDAEIKLVFAEDCVRLSVVNERAEGGDSCPSGLSATGAGYGIQGIQERILLVGGRVDAGPTAMGWTVDAEVPG